MYLFTISALFYIFDEYTIRYFSILTYESKIQPRCSLSNKKRTTMLEVNFNARKKSRKSETYEIGACAITIETIRTPSMIIFTLKLFLYEKNLGRIPSTTSGTSASSYVLSMRCTSGH